MKFLAVLGNKYFLYVVIAALSLLTLQVGRCYKADSDAAQEYNRQLLGQLDDKERDLQAAHTEMGVMKSELVTQKELNERLKKEKLELDKEFEKFKKEHDLIIKSKDQTIAELNQQINGGNSGTNTDQCKDLDKKNCIIKYNWEDLQGRFKLSDPDIFTLNNEIFKSNQIFSIVGEVWQQKDGSLQVRRIVLREVYKTVDGKYEPISNGKADIIDAKFEYTNDPGIPDAASWKDMFRLRPVAIGSVTAFTDSGRTRFGAGVQFFGWKALGINSHIAFDFKDIKKVEPRLGVSFNPSVFGKDLNFAVGASLGTPFAGMFKSYSANVDLIFYIF